MNKFTNDNTTLVGPSGQDTHFGEYTPGGWWPQWPTLPPHKIWKKFVSPHAVYLFPKKRNFGLQFDIFLFQINYSHIFLIFLTFSYFTWSFCRLVISSSSFPVPVESRTNKNKVRWCMTNGRAHLRFIFIFTWNLNNSLSLSIRFEQFILTKEVIIGTG